MGKAEKVLAALKDEVDGDREKIVDLLKKIAEWNCKEGSALRRLPDEEKKMWQVGEGDMDAPFLSEATLYPLLGKEDARTILSYLRRLSEVVTDEHLF